MEFMSASAFAAEAARESRRTARAAASWAVAVMLLLKHDGGRKQARDAQAEHGRNLCIDGELTAQRDIPKLEKLFACRGSSLVERRPEKAGVASSILAPGTIPRFQPQQVPIPLRNVSLPVRLHFYPLNVF